MRKTSVQTDAQQRQKAKKEQRMVVSTGINCLFTLLLAAVPNTLMLTATGSESNLFYEAVANWTYLLTLTNSLPNVLIYTMRHEELKENMKRLLRRCCCCSDGGVTTTPVVPFGKTASSRMGNKAKENGRSSAVIERHG